MTVCVTTFFHNCECWIWNGQSLKHHTIYTAYADSHVHRILDFNVGKIHVRESDTYCAYTSRVTTHAVPIMKAREKTKKM